MKQQKTECPACGNILQEHTLSEQSGCEAIRKLELEYYHAAARSDTSQEQAGTFAQTNICCPVCSKLSGEHTEDDLRSCLGKWRKREPGATGLPRYSVVPNVRRAGAVEEPDPVEHAKLKAQMLQTLCSCGKALGGHTPDEIRACFNMKRREEM
jgi:hypothetical protein